jgi:O-antigen ligase
MKKMAAAKQTYTLSFIVFLVFVAALPLLKVSSLLDQALYPRFAWLGLATLVFIGTHLKNLKLVNWPPGFLIALLGFVGLHVASLSTAINPAEAWATVARYGLMATFFAGLYGLLKTKKLTPVALLQGVLISTALIGLITAVQLLQSLASGDFFEDIYTITGPFTHKNLLSSALMLGLPFTLAGWVLLPGAWRKLALVVALLCVLEIFVLRTRGVWLGVIGSAIGTGLLFALTRQKKEKISLVWLGVFAGLALLVLGGLFASADLKAGITNRSNVDKRLAFWSNTADMIQEHPVLGVGAGNWKLLFPKYGLSAVDHSTMQGITHIQRPHNDYLWVWAESGPLGLFFYVALFILPIFQIIKNLRNSESNEIRILNYFAFMAIAAYAIFSFSDFPLERAPHTALFFTAIALVYSSASAEAKTFKAPWLPMVAGGLTLLALWVCYQRWQGEKDTVAVLEANAQQNARAIIPAAQKAHNPFYNLDPYANPLYYYEALGYQFSKKPQEALQRAKWAQEDAPYNILVFNAYANIYNALGQKNKALQYLDTALAISPKYEMAILLKANILMEQKRYPDALAALNFYPTRSNNERYLRALATALRGTLQSYPQHGRFKRMMEHLQKQPKLQQPMDYVNAYRSALSVRRGKNF